MNRIKEAGFSAIELLITLFIAAGFLLAAYQLYTVVLRDSGQSRVQALAANAANEYTRRYQEFVTIPCSALTPLNNSPQTIEGLSDVFITVSLSCPIPGNTSITKIETTLRYGTPEQTIRYATFRYSPEASNNEVLNGLIYWLPFNGTVNPVVGSAIGTVTGATNSSGQDGRINGAFAFNGTSQYITMPSDFLTIGTAAGQAYSFSFWYYATGSSTAFQSLFGKRTSGSGTTDYSIYTSGGSLSWGTGTTGDACAWGASTSITEPSRNTWHLVVATINQTGASTGSKTFWVDGAQVTNCTYAVKATTTTPARIGASDSTVTGFFSGSIDDLRVYNRILTTPEIQSLYVNGAR